MSVLLEVVLAGAAASAATNWGVALHGNSAGEGQSAKISNLTITAVASPAAATLLYPGGSGDVIVSITNPNPFPVTITGVQLPTNTTYATGYSTDSLTTTQIGCSASTPSDVIWSFSAATPGSSHVLATPITVAANGEADDPLTVTLTNEVSMTTEAPATCVNTYFSMPSLTGITATGRATIPTASPAIDSWTS